jgi:hypothetical protein
MLGFQGNERDHSSVCEKHSWREDLEGRLAGVMAVGSTLGQRNFPVSCEGAALSKIRGSGKAAQVLEEGNGSRETERDREIERERERAGWVGRLGEQGQCWEHT